MRTYWGPAPQRDAQSAHGPLSVDTGAGPAGCKPPLLFKAYQAMRKTSARERLQAQVVPTGNAIVRWEERGVSSGLTTGPPLLVGRCRSLAPSTCPWDLESREYLVMMQSSSYSLPLPGTRYIWLQISCKIPAYRRLQNTSRAV